jgi:outer membrane biosynthesis protein TonB
MKKQIGAVLTISLIAGFASLYKSSVYKSSGIPVEKKSNEASSADPKPEPSIQVPEKTQPDQIQNMIVDRETAPTPERVRAEVAQNPHVTPVSVSEFSIRLTPLMEAALASKEGALAAIPQLRQCATADAHDLVETARAICLIDLQRITQAYPDLQAEYRNAAGAVEPRVLLITQAVTSVR